MRVLIVKLSSLGDVVHTLPVVADIRAAHPGARIDWVVEPAFAPVVARVAGIGEVIECALRRWTREGWSKQATRAEAGAFVRRLRRDRYGAVVELQGLTKAGLTVDRKVMADLAMHEPAAFSALVEKARAALA